MRKIVQKDHPALRASVAEVTPTEFGRAAITELLREMSARLAEETDGIALAAPQLAVGKRIFIVSPKIFGANPAAGGKKNLIFINPRLVKLSRRRVLMEEGCLSVRWLYGNVPRALKASVEAYDETGKKFVRHASGLMAQIFQHEIDHLDGVLFTDKAKNLREVKPEHNKDE